ncbi:MAG: HigA family addiction module antidote protein [Burkholderiales bacterium]|nr:HigA family addiction module antidote protein [Burkholderiales bacterium]
MPKNAMRPVHPGEVLREEFLAPLGLSAHALAQALRVPATRINDVVNERRGITADTALRLARYFGTTAEFWLNLQSAFDLRKAESELKSQIERDVLPRAA